MFYIVTNEGFLKGISNFFKRNFRTDGKQQADIQKLESFLENEKKLESLVGKFVIKDSIIKEDKQIIKVFIELLDFLIDTRKKYNNYISHKDSEKLNDAFFKLMKIKIPLAKLSTLLTTFPKDASEDKWYGFTIDSSKYKDQIFSELKNINDVRQNVKMSLERYKEFNKLMQSRMSGMNSMHLFIQNYSNNSDIFKCINSVWKDVLLLYTIIIDSYSGVLRN